MSQADGCQYNLTAGSNWSVGSLKSVKCTEPEKKLDRGAGQGGVMCIHEVELLLNISGV